ncbi:MAG: hypothetical protein COT71_00080 [Candidatus Andersenbacteria bacterium CG10_big_fil_rev_8_21_14_0_10_54_11]|uniref:Uncharacterized protein n=1 Tax=Candidatus Andersenbacteria bacterium CG10_big_fil_rev_8_21_14_0_10_54_11 TaxID=1974485 RepID=A0A2M6X0G9_9BACT|nr:MAG: hypothetical protein COT71_00080 [Candidatus Andersenbacteria bacterium CG10_big_fil_rev_8_21_14_0_10_54_11]
MNGRFFKETSEEFKKSASRYTRGEVKFEKCGNALFFVWLVDKPGPAGGAGGRQGPARCCQSLRWFEAEQLPKLCSVNLTEQAGLGCSDHVFNEGR